MSGAEVFDAHWRRCATESAVLLVRCESVEPPVVLATSSRWGGCQAIWLPGASPKSSAS